jgi:hypothetical protein
VDGHFSGHIRSSVRHRCLPVRPKGQIAVALVGDRPDGGGWHSSLSSETTRNLRSRWFCSSIEIQNSTAMTRPGLYLSAMIETHLSEEADTPQIYLSALESEPDRMRIEWFDFYFKADRYVGVLAIRATII